MAQVSMLIGMITGPSAELRYGYHCAARLGSWTLTKDDAGFLLTAPVLSSTLWVSQRPLRLITSNGWRWPVESLETLGASCVARLGPKEKRHVPASATA